MLSKTRAHNVLSEFTDFILEDDIRGSIVVSIKEGYFKLICYELRKFNYRLVHKSQITGTKTFTLVFTVVD